LPNVFGEISPLTERIKHNIQIQNVDKCQTIKCLFAYWGPTLQVVTVIEVVNEVMRKYSFVPASEPKITNTSEVQETIWSLKVRKAPGPYDIPNRHLKHLPLRVVSLLVA